MKLRSILISGLCVLALSLVVTPVVVIRAQEEAATDAAQVSPAPTPTPSSGIYTRPRETEEIKRLRTLYQDQVEKYTALQREFYINRAQFQKLNTLQSLELAIQSAREVMIARDDVLITYFELLRASLVDTEGIELTEKQKNIDNLVSFINALKTHRQALLQTNERDQIATRADEFDTISVNFENVSYQSLALITIGDIQAVFDKSLIIYDDLKQYHKDNPTSPLQQEERDRAYVQVDRAIENSRASLNTAREKYAENQDLTRGNYGESIGKQINTSYSGTSQILSFLKELFLELT